MGHRTVSRLQNLHPLFLPLMAGLLLRLVAATFSTGYLMHDDHFMVVEAGASWAAGEDYNSWLPWNQTGEPKAKPANFAYVGTQFLVFAVLPHLGISDPQHQMWVIRILHGLYSCLLIVLAYGLARHLAPSRTSVAVTTAWWMAAGGFWPLLSVHQLVEMVCIPPLMWAFWALSREERLGWKAIVTAGIGIGIATGLRYQCGLFGIGLVPVLLFQKQLRALLAIGFTALTTFFLMQGADLFVWGEPLVQLRAYIDYNAENAGNYPSGPWYQYILTLLGLLIPPASLMILWGALHRRSAQPVWWRVLVPVVVFLIFHSAFVNKQERFILPAVPALLVLGAVGWDLWRQCSRWWSGRRRLEHVLWGAFWALNAVLLAGTVTYEAKRARVQAMSFLHDAGAEHFAIIQVDSGSMPPRFYSGGWHVHHIDDRRDGRGGPPAATAARWCAHPPEYLLFQGREHLAEAVQDYKADLPGIRYVTTIQSSRIDRWLERLNPLNASERIMVYAVDDALPCP